jgi:hypothetical protein
MKILKLIIAFAILTALFNSCSFIGNIFTYKAKTKEFVDALLVRNYDKDISLMNPAFINTQNKDTLKAALDHIRTILVNNFGDRLDYSFERASKTVSTESENNTPAGQTLVLIEISNKQVFGEIKLLFDDKSGKITGFNLQKIKEPIPNMLYFWLFGILVLAVLAFNIYVIVLVKRSKITKKWLKYLAVIFLNVPTIGYRAITGMFISASLQFMLGLSFYYASYIGSSVAFGLPIGGIIVLYRLKKGLFKTTDAPLLEEHHSTDKEGAGTKAEQNETGL